MGRAELSVNIDELDGLQKKLSSPVLEERLREIANRKEIAAIIAQAIADNFDKEGPGWKPLKGSTIRQTVSNGVLKRVVKDAMMSAAYSMGAVRTTKGGNRKIDYEHLKGQKKKFYAKVDRHLENVERAARTSEDGIGNRSILKRTGLLMKTVTTPGYTGSAKSGNVTIQGSNIYKVSGATITWGTNLIYAATHNDGTQEPKIPKREFLILHDEWKKRLTDLVARLMAEEIDGALT